MTYIINSLKKMSFKRKKRMITGNTIDCDNKFIIYIMIISIMVLVLDSILIVKFIELIKNI